jgi:hypothetical protein
MYVDPFLLITTAAWSVIDFEFFDSTLKANINSAKEIENGVNRSRRAALFLCLI